MKPIIAVTPEAIQLKRPDGRGAFVGGSYTDAVIAAGGIPWILPLTDDKAVLDDALDRCQGLLLTGGGDVNHKLYAPDMDPGDQARVADVDDVRDGMELHLIDRAIAADVPTFGICRGIQVINVALGGTLIPDLPSSSPSGAVHRHPEPTAMAHPIQWRAGTRLATLLGADVAAVNSSHHQAVDRLASGLTFCASAPDGVIEAVERSQARFFVAVQFHPERLVESVPAQRRLFAEFVRAAAG
jgi:putative glutamine amidotransferase